MTSTSTPSDAGHELDHTASNRAMEMLGALDSTPESPSTGGKLDAFLAGIEDGDEELALDETAQG
jgi:hypothetical protein